MSFLKNLEIVIRARYPLIYISSTEEERVETTRYGRGFHFNGSFGKSFAAHVSVQVGKVFGEFYEKARG